MLILDWMKTKVISWSKISLVELTFKPSRNNVAISNIVGKDE